MANRIQLICRIVQNSTHIDYSKIALFNDSFVTPPKKKCIMKLLDMKKMSIDRLIIFGQNKTENNKLMN